MEYQLDLLQVLWNTPSLEYLGLASTLAFEGYRQIPDPGHRGLASRA